MVHLGQTALVPLNRAAGDLQGQLYRALRARILSGGLAAGARLPSTRQLALSLGLARATVVGAYERLQAEGYLLHAPGKASRVADIPPLAAPSPRPIWRAPSHAALPSSPTTPLTPTLLAPGVPDLSSFPTSLWARALAAQTRRLTPATLGYQSPFGLPEVREAILAHISITRGVVATPNQVLLFPSTRAAIALIARLVLPRLPSKTNNVWVEDPAYPSACQILHQAGGQLVPIPVDSAGLNLDHTDHLPPPCLIYVTPSHQYPTGVTLSLARRLRLLEQAQSHNAIILEDDYDSEFQFDGRPVTSVQGIDPDDRVAYLGTLAKVLAPGLRLAYAVVPRRLLARAQQVVMLEGLTVSAPVQAAFLALLQDGQFSAHIKRMTTHYATRMAAFRAAILQVCAGCITPGPGTGGLQLALWFTDTTLNDEALAQTLKLKQYAPQPLSPLYQGTPRPGLLCGIANLVPDRAMAIAQDLARSLSPPHQFHTKIAENF